MKNKSIYLQFLKIIIIIFVLGLIMFPILYAVIVSFYSNHKVQANNIKNILPNSINFNSYKEALKNGYWKALGYSALFAFVLVIFKLFIYSTAGYSISQKYKMRKYIIALLMIINVIPENVLLVGLLTQFNSWGINFSNNLIFGLVFPSIFGFFGILMFRNAFNNVSQNEKRMATLDGLNMYRRLTSIYLPKMNLAVSITVITTTATAWNSYLWPTLFLHGSDVKILSTWIFSIGNTPLGGQLMNVRMAGSVLFMLPIIIVYFVSNKKIRKSFESIV